MYACSRSISISRFSILRFLRRRATFLREMGIDLKNIVAKLQLATRPLFLSELSGRPSDVLLLSRPIFPTTPHRFPPPSHSLFSLLCTAISLETMRFTAIFSSSSFYDTGSFGKFDLEYLDYCVKADIKLYYRMKGGVKLIWRGNNFKIVSKVC